MHGASVRPIYVAGECEIDLGRRELRVLGSPAPLGGRAFEMLEVLAAAAGELVTKDQLFARIWSGTVVNENALQVHISAVRKALGSYRSLLKTESGRGYRLLGGWVVRQQSTPPSHRVAHSPDQTAARNPRSNLPALVTDLIGRQTALPHLTKLLSAHRIVTLSGAGGVGKTTLALHAARELLPAFADGVWLVELALLSDASLVPSAVSSVLGLELGGTISADAVTRSIGANELLLVLDNCEHVIEAVATLAETLVRLCPRVTVLATSREVLRIGGEYVYRVPSLDVPAVEQSGEAVLRAHSAVELFIARRQASNSTLLPQSDSLSTIASICRHLDGIPLAIEFAAARAATLGIEPVHAEIRDRFALLTSGRRTAVPRHQTLRATLDWSYGLLPESERRLLCRLAVLSGSFGREAAEALMDAPGRGAPSVMDGIANLVDKSLVIPDRTDAGRWRLLETTRAYAVEKQAESGEAGVAARCHAEFFLATFEKFDVESQATFDALSFYRREVDNLRSALSWTFSGGGDAAMGTKLVAAACDFWIAESLVAECCDWCGRALAQIGDAAGTRCEMVLQCGRGRALLYTKGMVGEARTALERGLAIAQELEDLEYQQRAAIDLWRFKTRSALMNEALASACQFEEFARDRGVLLRTTADWLVGVSLTYPAAHAEAAARLQRASEQYPVERRDRDLVRIGFNIRATAGSHLAINLLSLGLLDRASEAAIGAIDEARESNHATLCITLAWSAGLTFLSLEELDLAERFGEELIDHAYRHGMRPYHAVGLCIRGSIAAKRGDLKSAIASLRAGLRAMQETAYLAFHSFFSSKLAMALGAGGRIDEALGEIDQALDAALRADYAWFVPEILRVRAELLLLLGTDDPSTIEGIFDRSMSYAQDRQALYWQLCTGDQQVGTHGRPGQDRRGARAVGAPVQPLHRRALRAEGKAGRGTVGPTAMIITRPGRDTHRPATGRHAQACPPCAQARAATLHSSCA